MKKDKTTLVEALMTLSLGVFTDPEQLQEFDYFKAWLLFFLIATIGGGVISLVVVSFGAAFLGAGAMPLPQITRILQVVGFVISISISYVIFRAVVGKYLSPKIEDDAGSDGQANTTAAIFCCKM